MLDLNDLGKKILEKQPFSQFIGCEMVQLCPGQAELRLPLRSEHLQQHGLVHGGVVSYLADNAITFAGGAIYGDAVTVEFKINYLKGARPQAAAGSSETKDSLIARAHARHQGKQLAICQCDIYLSGQEGEQLVASAQGTVMAHRASSSGGQSPPEIRHAPGRS